MPDLNAGKTRKNIIITNNYRPNLLTVNMKNNSDNFEFHGPLRKIANS